MSFKQEPTIAQKIEEKMNDNNSKLRVKHRCRLHQTQTFKDILKYGSQQFTHNFSTNDDVANCRKKNKTA